MTTIDSDFIRLAAEQSIALTSASENYYVSLNVVPDGIRVFVGKKGEVKMRVKTTVHWQDMQYLVYEVRRMFEEAHKVLSYQSDRD